MDTKSYGGTQAFWVPLLIQLWTCVGEYLDASANWLIGHDCCYCHWPVPLSGYVRSWGWHVDVADKWKRLISPELLATPIVIIGQFPWMAIWELSVCMLKSQPMGTGELSVTIQRLLSSSLASPPAGIGLHSALMSGDVNSGHNEHWA